MSESPNLSISSGLSLDEQLLLVYEDLRRLAQRYVRCDKAGVTLGATGLVHEAWIKIRGTLGDGVDCSYGERDYYLMLAQAMRRVLVDRARQKKSLRKGGGLVRVSLRDDSAEAPFEEADIVALNAAVDRLAAESPIHAEILSLKYFADLTNEQVGEMLDCSPHWVRRQWTYARARILYFMDEH
ncbi:MAG: ECF-type sigma factor [Planctomycetaceae bacterium]|jgi:RNA polymerase sigma factor (TIGR02999 family)